MSGRLSDSCRSPSGYPAIFAAVGAKSESISYFAKAHKKSRVQHPIFPKKKEKKNEAWWRWGCWFPSCFTGNNLLWFNFRQSALMHKTHPVYFIIMVQNSCDLRRNATVCVLSGLGCWRKVETAHKSCQKLATPMPAKTCSLCYFSHWLTLKIVSLCCTNHCLLIHISTSISAVT